MLDLPRDAWTFVHALRAQARLLGEAPFLTFSDGTALSFAELDRASDRVAAGLARLGLGPGDRVLALLRNSPAFLLALFGALKRGVIFSTINTELKGAFLEHQLRNTDPAAVLVDDELRPAFDSVNTSGLSVTHTVIAGSGAAAALPGTARVHFGELSESAQDSGPLVIPRPQDVAMIMYTSGTTGPSKGVLMPHGHCYLAGLGLATTVRLMREDRYYVCMPLFHANGLLMQIGGCLLAGTPAHVARRFSASTWLEEVRASGATVTNALGVMPEFIFRQPATARDREHRLRLIMAVPIAEEWGAAFEERFGVRFFQGFGMTECNIVAYSDAADPLLPGCAGRVLSDWFDVRILDPETDEPLPADTVGEIAVRPKLAWGTSTGYFRMPEKTVEAWRNLWFHSGDRVVREADGTFKFVDRLKDAIRRRGENISSFEVEQVLLSHPDVATAAVFPIRSELGEDEVMAAVVLRARCKLSELDLVRHCEPQLAYFAVPRYIEFVDELPVTENGKVQKFKLRERGLTPKTWDREASGYKLKRI